MPPHGNDPLDGLDCWKPGLVMQRLESMETNGPAMGLFQVAILVCCPSGLDQVKR